MGMICEGILHKGYVIERNYCNCHPETCCCKDYCVYKDGVKITYCSSINNAKSFIDNLIKIN